MNKSTLFLFFAWLTATVSVAGSLFFSEFLKLPPCSLCWYQRIFMFPLVLIFWIGISSEDARAHVYGLPLIIVGWLIAAYHNLLYYKWIADSLVPCTGGTSCTERQLELFGFMSIPLMSLCSFTLIFIFVLMHRKALLSSPKSLAQKNGLNRSFDFH